MFKYRNLIFPDVTVSGLSVQTNIRSLYFYRKVKYTKLTSHISIRCQLKYESVNEIPKLGNVEEAQVT